MHPLVQQTLRKAAAAGAAIDFIADWDDLVELERMAVAIERPPAEERLALLAAPIVVGGVPLYRLSLGALEWLMERALPWFDGDADLQDLLVAYAMANVKAPEVFLRLHTAKAARTEVLGWARTVRASKAELGLAMTALMSVAEREPDTPAGKSAQSHGFGPIIAHLVDRFGGAPDYWMWECPDGFALYMMQHADRVPAPGSMGIARGGAPDPDGWHARATWRFQKAAKAYLQSVVNRTRNASAGSDAVKHGNDVHEKRPGEGSNDPSANRRKEEEPTGGAPAMDSLSPSGDDQRSQPVVEFRLHGQMVPPAQTGCKRI